MIFYLATDTEGYRQLRTTQALAKSVNKQFDQLDVPVDKNGLCGALQELLTEADYATKKLDDVRGTAVKPEPGSIERITGHTASPASNADVDHDRRCRKCHLQLTATERGAKLLAAGEDMTALAEWIDQMPRWAIDGIQSAIDARNQADADDKHAAIVDDGAVDLPFEPTN